MIGKTFRKMRAIICRNWCSPDDLCLADLPSPSLAPDQVRLRVNAVGINFADTLMVAGKYQVKPSFPFSPGLECSGEIVEMGPDVVGFKIGQRVMAISRFGGAYAEELITTHDYIVPIPDEMDFITAASFPVAYGTAHFSLTHRGQLQAGEILLVTGAAGGVGLAAIEVGKQLGAMVIAAAGSKEKLAIAKSHGADHLINYAKESICARVKEITNGSGFDVLFDPVGGGAFEQSLRATNWQARLLIVGFAGGRIQQVPANHVLVKNVSVIGVVWGAQAAREPIVVTRGLNQLLTWWQAGRLKPHVAKTFPLEEAPAAMKALLSRAYPGKIILTC